MISSLNIMAKMFAIIVKLFVGLLATIFAIRKKNIATKIFGKGHLDYKKINFS